jgi:hypothetical protein
MSGAYDDDLEEAPPHPAEPAQPLVDFVNAFTDPQAQEVFADAAIKVQDYVTQRQIAADNSAAGARLISNLGQFKDGLVGMVQSDPAAVVLGLDLVPDVVEGIVQTHPWLPEDQRQSTQEQLTTDMQREIARAGVMSWADRDAEAARGMLAMPRLEGLFTDQDRTALNGYIGAMDTARTADAAALAKQREQDAARTQDFATVNYFNALLDPRTQELSFPTGWAQKVTSDPSVSPGYTAAMLGIYDRLQTGGDAAASDPFLAADLIDAAAKGNGSMPAVLGNAGNGLRLTDAITIAGMAGPQSENGKAVVGALNEVVQHARSVLADPFDGPAGQKAFSNFVNWLLPAVRAGAVSLNPEEPGYAGLRLPQFAPSTSDLVLPTPIEGRPSLDDIFGAKRGR